MSGSWAIALRSSSRYGSTIMARVYEREGIIRRGSRWSGMSRLQKNEPARSQLWRACSQMVEAIVLFPVPAVPWTQKELEDTICASNHAVTCCRILNRVPAIQEWPSLKRAPRDGFSFSSMIRSSRSSVTSVYEPMSSSSAELIRTTLSIMLCRKT